MHRTHVEISCHGSSPNAVTLTATDWQTAYGVSRPKNVGECPLYLNWVDKDGDWERDDVVKLPPGEEIYAYRPKSDRAAKIKVAAANNCYGEGWQENDTPYF